MYSRQSLSQSIPDRGVSTCPLRHPRRIKAFPLQSRDAADEDGTRTHIERPANQSSHCRECMSPDAGANQSGGGLNRDIVRALGGVVIK